MRFGGIGSMLLAITLAASWPQLHHVECRPVAVRTTNRSRPPLPVIFLPGKGGNQLEARVDRTGLDQHGLEHCEKKAEWYRIWMDLWTFFNGGVDCWVENMELRFNQTSKKSSNAPGVETRVPGWGTTEGMEYVDPSWTAWVLGNIGIYANYLIEALVHNGYERGVNVRGAPYDFRYAPHSQTTFFDDLRTLVEQTWTSNGHRKVVLVGHSMGGLYGAYFLQHQPAEWKDRYVEALVTLNTPWAGTVVVIEMHAAGINWEIDAIDRLVVRGQQRRSETGFLLLPSADVWNSDDVLLTTPDRNFTVDDYGEFFDAIGYPDGRLQLEEFQSYRWFDHPVGVPVHCLHGGGVPTVETVIYDAGAKFPDGQPRTVMGEGDGTVNLRSLDACRRWQQTDPSHPVFVKQYHGIGHNELLSHSAVISDILRVTNN